MARVWVRRSAGGHVMGLAFLPGTGGHDEALPEDHPDVVAYLGRDASKPWPDYLTWTPEQHQAHEDERAIDTADAKTKALVILIKLIDKLVEKGTIAATDFDAETKAEYQELKAIADRLRPTA